MLRSLIRPQQLISRSSTSPGLEGTLSIAPWLKPEREAHLRILLPFLLSITSAVAFTQQYPTKPVRLIDPFGAGGGPNVLAHTLSQKLSELWGRPLSGAGYICVSDRATVQWGAFK